MDYMIDDNTIGCCESTGTSKLTVIQYNIGDKFYHVNKFKDGECIFDEYVVTSKYPRSIDGDRFFYVMQINNMDKYEIYDDYNLDTIFKNKIDAIEQFIAHRRHYIANDIDLTLFMKYLTDNNYSIKKLILPVLDTIAYDLKDQKNDLKGLKSRIAKKTEEYNINSYTFNIIKEFAGINNYVNELYNKLTPNIAKEFGAEILNACKAERAERCHNGGLSYAYASDVFRKYNLDCNLINYYLEGTNIKFVFKGKDIIYPIINEKELLDNTLNDSLLYYLTMCQDYETHNLTYFSEHPEIII